MSPPLGLGGRRRLRADLAIDEVAWATNLAVFRIAFLTAGALPTLLTYWDWMRTSMPGLEPPLWEPIAFYRYLPESVLLSAPLAHALTALAIALVLLGVLGLRTRLTLALATVATLYVLGLPQNQGKVHHYHNVVWFMALLAAGPSGHALSLDARRRKPAAPPPAGARATLVYVWVLLGLVYLLPGLGKLESALLGEWTTADQQRRLLWNKWIQLEWYEPTIRPFVRPDAWPDWVLAAGAVATIAFEVGFLALLLTRRTRGLATVLGLGFHLMTGLALGIYFRFLLPTYVALMDWSRLASRGGPDAQGSPPAPRAPRPPRRVALVHWVGAGLVAGQVVVGGLTLLEGHYWRARTVLLDIRPWPFDAYQVFTSDARPTLVTWELRIHGHDGRDVPVAPAVFEQAFGTPGFTQDLFKRVAREPDQARQRTMSLALVRAIARHLPEETWPRARGVRAYVSRWRVRRPPPELIDRVLIGEFAPSELRPIAHRPVGRGHP